MSRIREFDTVRVANLVRESRDFDGTSGVARAPRVGDTGIVVHEYNPHDPQAPVAVEMVDRNGYTIWLADFEKQELELVTR